MKASALRHRQPQTTELTGLTAEHLRSLLVIVELVCDSEIHYAYKLFLTYQINETENNERERVCMKKKTIIFLKLMID